MKKKAETWIEEYLKMIDDCEDRESRLTEWEIGFLESVRTRVEAALPLSSKQTEVLDRIWNHATARG
jgi:hypothetical protein